MKFITWWKPRLVPAAVYTTMTAIVAIMALVSYEHEYDLARLNGQVPWVSSILPFTVDGMIAISSVVILWALANGIRKPWRPWIILAVGILATISANLYAGLHYPWLGRAVSAWSGVAMVLVADVVMWFISKRRKLADGEPVNRKDRVPPPVSLAEALPLARAELRRRGAKSGEEALAAAFGVSRYEVRKVLLPAVEPPRDCTEVPSANGEVQVEN